LDHRLPLMQVSHPCTETLLSKPFRGKIRQSGGSLRVHVICPCDIICRLSTGELPPLTTAPATHSSR
jgi:hypothetical protein